jgi:DNA-binding response OmpR family regulator
MKVLILDADWHFLQQARDFLESRGHLTCHITEPAQAVAKAEHWRPDLVVVSTELKGCGDGDLLERLSLLEPRPAILLTANLDRFAQAWRAWQKGGDEVLFKPLLHPSELHVAIVTALENSLCPQGRARTAQTPALSA